MRGCAPVRTRAHLSHRSGRWNKMTSRLCLRDPIERKAWLLLKGAASAIRRFGNQEFAIRRAYVADPEFRELCHYYASALRALERWSADEGRAGDYRQIAEELEEEITEYLAKRCPR